MSVLSKFLNMLFVLLFSVISFSFSVYSVSFNVCNTEINEPWFIVQENITNKDILIVDSEGDIYFEGKDHLLNNNGTEKTFQINTIYFNKITSKFTSFSQNQLIVPTDNSLVIQNNIGTNVASFSNTGAIYTKGKSVYNGSQAGCMPDGNYCNGNVVEIRNNFCDLIGTKTGVCSYTTLGSEDCSLKLSTDSDGGINYNLAGTVTDYTSCSSGSCTNNTYVDSCSSSTNLIEYYNNGVSYSSSNSNCASANYNYCNGINVYRTNNLCGDGSCYSGTSTFLQSCSASATSYGTWACNDINTKIRTNIVYTPQCSSGACVANYNPTNTPEVIGCGSGNYCTGGNCQLITYSWYQSGFGVCSANCGEGLQYQTVYCKRNYDAAQVADSYCSGAKPTLSQTCNLGVCSCTSHAPCLPYKELYDVSYSNQFYLVDWQNGMCRYLEGGTCGADCFSCNSVDACEDIFYSLGINYDEPANCNTFISATGGTITYDGNYKIHTFTTVGTSSFNVVLGSGTVDILVVAGGGGGAGSGYGGGGGGGAGGMLEQTSRLVTAGTYTVIVGAGGSGGILDGMSKGSNGGNSVFDTSTAIGGGGGATIDWSEPGNNGGSGGGGPGTASSFPGTATQSNSGGATGYGYNGGEGNDETYGGGGGGAGGAGVVSTKGPGRSNSISGSPVIYAQGGEGGYGQVGGLGVPNHPAGAVNTGSGGGGGHDSYPRGYYAGNAGAAGGSGVVIVRYQYQ